MKSRSALLFVASVVYLGSGPGCGNSSEPAEPTPVKQNSAASAVKTKAQMTREMKPTSAADKPKFESGHAITPAADLLEWIEKNARVGDNRTRFKLPVVIVFDDLRMGATKMFVGADASESGDDRLTLDFDDGAMGIGLFAQLRTKCAKDAPACAVWLECMWGRHLEGGPKMPPPPNADPSAHMIAVLAVGELIAEGAGGADVKAQIEK